MRLLVHIATGPENPTRLALGLLVARTAVEEGHEVEVFLAGDGVHALRPETREQVHGVGTGSAAEHWDVLARSDARLFASGMSSTARGVGPTDGVELSPPQKLVALIAGADRVVSY
jgi:predicted peroxiredoxin